MKRIIYLGMENKPFEVFETAHVENFKVVYQYENNNGKRVMLRATQDTSAYYPAHDNMKIINNNLPICKTGKLYPINILNKGYSGHHFTLVEA